MNEKLKKDLCARLPYGVKMYIKTNLLYYTNKPYKENKRVLTTSILGKIFKGSQYNEIKPILFPLSCLTKEITINNYNNGKPFNPIDEINRLASLDNEICQTIEWDYSEDHFLINVDYFYGGWEITFITDLLNKWHINYRLAPEQFIEATNEYQ